MYTYSIFGRWSFGRVELFLLIIQGKNLVTDMNDIIAFL